jgi:hypothetical protein
LGYWRERDRATKCRRRPSNWKQFLNLSGFRKSAYEDAGWNLFVAGSITGHGSNIFSPFGTKPKYTDMQQSSFDSAGEKAIGGSAEYDFSGIGLPGVTAGAWYTRGWDTINATNGLAIPDRNELDLWLQYRATEGDFKGLRVKAQYANVWQDGNVRDTQPEFRFIVDYTILFGPPIK